MCRLKERMRLEDERQRRNKADWARLWAAPGFAEWANSGPPTEFVGYDTTECTAILTGMAIQRTTDDN